MLIRRGPIVLKKMLFLIQNSFWSETKSDEPEMTEHLVLLTVI